MHDIHIKRASFDTIIIVDTAENTATPTYPATAIIMQYRIDSLATCRKQVITRLRWVALPPPAIVLQIMAQIQSCFLLPLAVYPDSRCKVFSLFKTGYFYLCWVFTNNRIHR